MKQLIISIYDSCTDFTFVVLDNGKEIKRSKAVFDLREYDLVDEEYLWFDEERICFSNTKIKQFDLIIICEDGKVSVHRPKED